MTTIIDQILDRVSIKCNSLTPARMHQAFARDHVQGNYCEPGRCRFCGESLGVEQIEVESGSGTIIYPVIQCDFAAKEVYPRYFDEYHPQGKKAIERKLLAARAKHETKPNMGRDNFRSDF